jgi:disease resistance protein RPM1
LLLTGTGIEELPTSLGQLTKLMCLRADDKTRVPDWISKLTSLVELLIHSAPDHKFFFKELGKLTDLREVHINTTPQDEGQVWEFLQALSNLQKLEVADFQAWKYFACTDAIMQPSFELCCNSIHYSRSVQILKAAQVD